MMEVAPDYDENGQCWNHHLKPNGASGSKSKEDTKMVEATLALYKVTPLGGLQRNTQCDVRMGRHF